MGESTQEVASAVWTVAMDAGERGAGGCTRASVASVMSVPRANGCRDALERAVGNVKDVRCARQASIGGGAGGVRRVSVPPAMGVSARRDRTSQAVAIGRRAHAQIAPSARGEHFWLAVRDSAPVSAEYAVRVGRTRPNSRSVGRAKTVCVWHVQHFRPVLMGSIVLVAGMARKDSAWLARKHRMATTL